MLLNKNLTIKNILNMLILIFLVLNIFRSFSLEEGASSGSNLCSRLGPEVESFLLYDENQNLYEYLNSQDFNGMLNLGYVNYLESNLEDGIYYISAYLYDSDYYEGKIRTWLVNDIGNPNLVYEIYNEEVILKPTSNFKILDFNNDSAYKLSSECTRVEKFLYEQRN